MDGSGSVNWPRNADRTRKLTMLNPILDIQVCEKCWDGRHPKMGCKTPGCQCGCYHGRNKGLNGKLKNPLPELAPNLEFSGEPLQIR